MKPDDKPFAAGSLLGVIYDFAQGDVLDEHVHDASTAHISILTYGKLRWFGPWGERTQMPGEILKWDAEVPHGCEAHAPSRLINIQTQEQGV